MSYIGDVKKRIHKGRFIFYPLLAFLIGYYLVYPNLPEERDCLRCSGKGQVFIGNEECNNCNSSGKVYSGTTSSRDNCSSCGGTGDCYYCNGKGDFPCVEHDWNGDGYCTDCNNTGRVACQLCLGWNGSCPTCDGRGSSTSYNSTYAKCSRCDGTGTRKTYTGCDICDEEGIWGGSISKVDSEVKSKVVKKIKDILNSEGIEIEYDGSKDVAFKYEINSNKYINVINRIKSKHNNYGNADLRLFIEESEGSARLLLSNNDIKDYDIYMFSVDDIEFTCIQFNSSGYYRDRIVFLGDKHNEAEDLVYWINILSEIYSFEVDVWES